MVRLFFSLKALIYTLRASALETSLPRESSEARSFRFTGRTAIYKKEEIAYESTMMEMKSRRGGKNSRPTRVRGVRCKGERLRVRFPANSMK